MSSGIKIVFGGYPIGATRDLWNNKQAVEELYKTLKEEKVDTIDTAQLYEGSEQLIGETNGASQFNIDTKFASGFRAGQSTRENVIAAANESLKKLKTNQVDVYYLHSPDRKVPFKETFGALDELHKQGKFKRLGLSNFTAEDVEEALRVCKENNYVLPTVYQGNYSAVTRKIEASIIPLLRKNNFAFYAYSPIAGGFLAKTKDQVLQGVGRFDPSTQIGQMYNNLYNKPSLLKALEIWDDISKSAGIPKAELAYRWITYHSALKPEYGDAVIIGARDLTQLKGTVKSIRNGPLSEDVAKKIESVWKLVEHDAPLDNFNA